MIVMPTIYSPRMVARSFKLVTEFEIPPLPLSFAVYYCKASPPARLAL